MNWVRVGSTAPHHFAHPTSTFGCFQFHVFLGMENYKWELQTHNETFPKRDFWLVPHLPDPPCPVSTTVQMDSSQRTLQPNCEQKKYCKSAVIYPDTQRITRSGKNYFKLNRQWARACSEAVLASCEFIKALNVSATKFLVVFLVINCSWITGSRTILLWMERRSRFPEVKMRVSGWGK